MWRGDGTWEGVCLVCNTFCVLCVRVCGGGMGGGVSCDVIHVIYQCTVVHIDDSV